MSSPPPKTSLLELRKRLRSLPGGLRRLCSVLPRRLQKGSSHHHLRLLPTRWSRPGRPRALSRKPEAGEAPGGEEGIRAEVRAPGHHLLRAHSSGRTKGRHWGRSPSASGPTWAFAAAKRFPPPTTVLSRRRLRASGIGGRQRGIGRLQPIPSRSRPLHRAPSGHGPYRSTRTSEKESEARNSACHA